MGLVLSGGGAKGFTYIGLLRVIREAGLPIDYIGGTGIGSIMAGLYAVVPVRLRSYIELRQFHRAA